MDSLLVAMKWACLGNAIFMLLWMGFRILTHGSFYYILVDGFIVMASVLIAERYHNDEY